MAVVRDILAGKGNDVESIGLEHTVLDAAERMNARKIGSLAVLDGDALVGILTERDLLARVIVQRRDPVSTRVEDVMTSEVIVAHPDDALDDVRSIMKSRRIRHLPVLDSGKLIGMISIGDLNAQASHDREVTLHVLEDYIAGRA